jgi:copper chaperone CopZ
MACPRCVRAVTASLRDLDGVRTVQADTTSATVILSGDVEIGAALQALHDCGYRGSLPGPGQPMVKDTLQGYACGAEPTGELS